MDPAIIVAIIALVASVISATVSLFGDVLLASWTARREMKSVLARYRETLAEAAYELQARLWNILKLEFLQTYYLDGEDTEREYAVENTLYVVAQYLAWVQALRRDVHLSRFPQFRDPVGRRTDGIGQLFGSDDPGLGDHFRVWRGEQQAIGELMLSYEDGRPQCLTYARFVEHQGRGFRKWFARLEKDIPALAADPSSERLRQLQNELVDLVRELDITGRYSDAPLEKASR
jgi:hypothetical protein